MDKANVMLISDIGKIGEIVALFVPVTTVASHLDNILYSLKKFQEFHHKLKSESKTTNVL